MNEEPNKDKLTDERKIDVVAGSTESYVDTSFVVMRKKTISTWKGLVILLFTTGTIVATSMAVHMKIQTNSSAKNIPPQKSALMHRVKFKGCVADGLLSGYGGDTKKSVEMINHSECQYLHRALETWATPPNFAKAQDIKKMITKKDVIWGMFLAEAINVNSSYPNPATGKSFDFKNMCRPDSLGFWSPDLCKAYLPSTEYQQYLKVITRQAIDMGIQSFMFGQVHFQDDLANPVAPAIVRDMREYAAATGKEIVIGAQTNTIADSNYLQNFDYIEGGVGLANSGKIEKGACSERWLRDGWCWALVWNKKYASHANDVLVHFDWSGIAGDDLSVFAQMSRERRAQILRDMRLFFTNRNVGFLFPLMGTLYNQNGGCYGPSRDFYSANRDYSCQDEIAINEILRADEAAAEQALPTVEEILAPPPIPAESLAPQPETITPVPETIVPPEPADSAPPDTVPPAVKPEPSAPPLP